MISIQIRVTKSDGEFVAWISDFVSCNYVLRTDGEIGALELMVPGYYGNIFNSDAVDYRLTVWRSINNGPYYLDGKTEFLARKWLISTDLVVFAPSIQILLQRRVVGYYTNDLNASVFSSIYAGNLMKTLVRQNFTTAIGVDRDGSLIGTNISTYLSVASDINDGIILSYECARRNVFTAIQEISKASEQYGIFVAGLVQSTGARQLQFNTYANYSGFNRKQLVLSPKVGNVQNCVLTIDRIEEITSVTALGSGTDKGRLISSADDETRIYASVFGRSETTVENTQVKIVAQLTALANNQLRLYKPFQQFDCDLVPTPGFARGLHYDMGDLLTVQYNGTSLSMRLDVVEVSLQNGQWKEKASLRGVI